MVWDITYVTCHKSLKIRSNNKLTKKKFAKETKIKKGEKKKWKTGIEIASEEAVHGKGNKS